MPSRLIAHENQNSNHPHHKKQSWRPTTLHTSPIPPSSSRQTSCAALPLGLTSSLSNRPRLRGNNNRGGVGGGDISIVAGAPLTNCRARATGVVPATRHLARRRRHRADRGCGRDADVMTRPALRHLVARLRRRRAPNIHDERVPLCFLVAGILLFGAAIFRRPASACCMCAWYGDLAAVGGVQDLLFDASVSFERGLIRGTFRDQTVAHLHILSETIFNNNNYHS